MIRRTLSVVVLAPLVLAIVVLAPDPLFLVFLDLVLLIGILELFQLLAPVGVRKPVPAIVVCLLLPWVWNQGGGAVTAYLLGACLCLLTAHLYRVVNHRDALASASASLLALLYLGLPVSLLAGYRTRSGELLMILAIVWSCDIAAYLVGTRWGRRRITPRLSPAKSLEGFAAGLAAALAAALIVGYGLLGRSDWGLLSLLGVLVGSAAILGDLFESLLKRAVAAKDSGSLIPGHGGLLDRIDSLLFAFPVHHCLSFLLG
jgi:phosphatidate cytidylyltransferase